MSLYFCVSGGFDHVRVHPKFLHSNATSHKWALGGIFIDQPLFEIGLQCGCLYFYELICFLVFSCAAFAELLDNALDEVGLIS